MEKNLSLPQWIEFFLNEVFPNITKEESDFISVVLSWSEEKKTAFKFAKNLFEEDMDKLIKKDKVKIDKMMNTLIKKDIPRDKELKKCKQLKKK